MDPLQPGDPDRIGGYRLTGRLGAGGMGVVYFGRSAGGRPVAVKVIRSEYAGDPQFRARFAREIEAARRVGGFHTAPVVDADPVADPPWMVTAYVAGPSLDDAVEKDGPLSPDALRTLGAGLAEGLAAIHACGVVHRDLKPGNVLLAHDGPRIIDFGIARATGTATGSGSGTGTGTGTSTSTGDAMTTAGAVLGTFLFMSPEQLHARPVGAESDVFSLGGVLAFAASGTAPFEATSLMNVMHRITTEEPDLRRVPAAHGLRPLVAACLAKDPRDRPAVAQVLGALADGGVRPGNGVGPEGGPAPGGSGTGVERGRVPAVAVATATTTAVDPVADPAVDPAADPAVTPARAGGRAVHAQATVSAPPRPRPRPQQGAPYGPPGAAAPPPPVAAGTGAGPRSPAVLRTRPATTRRRALVALGAVAAATAIGVPLALKTAAGQDGVPLSAGGEYVLNTAFSPDGRQLAGGCEASVQVWNPSTGERVVRFREAQASSNCAPAFSGDSRVLAVADVHGTVHVWGDLGRTFVAAPRSANSLIGLAVSPDGGRVYGVGDGQVQVWHTTGGGSPEAWRVTSPAEEATTCSVLTPDGRTLVVGCGDGTLRALSTATGRTTAVGRAASGLRKLAVSADGSVLAGIGTRDETVHLWNLPAVRRRPVGLRHAGTLPLGLGFGGDGTLAVCYDDNSIRLWNPRSHRVTRTIGEGGKKSEQVALSPDGRVVVGTSRGSYLWRLRA
ncbi:WD40 repeat domain-containing serine/threonine protein kinase [Streptomyces sp. TS71-3]|uniref:WD40 repeat domain-containing serine/threonine protein kinase n=1 Tax=Streptomyces sp. TS71-3 TaxID=2733862 RepID=UPI001B0A9F71|nr:serine/threonine-protein kinase [Streptomyces sp. TS71-3]GHJ36589.1 hypothetical protein Sm713_21980 [Streptomyces sp. TS71-3]